MRRLLISCFFLACCADSEPRAEERIEVKDYALCDGSDDVRLSIGYGGGFVPESVLFTGNGRFLRVNGQCDFVGALGGDERGWISGKLTAAQALELEQQFDFRELETLLYRDVLSCPDAGTVSIATLHGYADCTCGCDAGVPRAVSDAMIALEAAFSAARVSGMPLRGPVEVIAAEQTASSEVQGADWPFAFPITDIAVTSEQFVASDFAKARTLEGADADKARSLRDAASIGEPAGHYAADNKGYALFVREKMPSAFNKSLPAPVSQP
jgi:hypothetical protein